MTGPTLYTYRATVTAVHDGDTVSLAIDLGFGITQNLKRVRLAGINAPELATTEGPVALQQLRTLLGPLPVSLTVQTFKDKADAYGRVLVRLLDTSGNSINARMVGNGHAQLLGPFAP